MTAVRAVPERSQRIGATLVNRARIAVTHRARHRIEAGVQRGGIMIEQHRLDVEVPLPSGALTSA